MNLIVLASFRTMTHIHMSLDKTRLNQSLNLRTWWNMDGPTAGPTSRRYLKDSDSVKSVFVFFRIPVTAMRKKTNTFLNPSSRAHPETPS